MEVDAVNNAQTDAANACNKEAPQPEPTAVSKFRRLLPQVLASITCNLMMVELSSSVFFSTVVIGQLQNTTGPLALDNEKSSWIGSILFICQPVGSLVSGVLTDLLGRKRVMLLMNLPFLVGWVLMCTAPSYAVLCVASVIMGITIGLMEAPLGTYIGEVCQPTIRGIMSSSAGVMFQAGTVLVLLTGTLTDWRKTAGICAALPIFTAVCMIMVPETPAWLLSKSRVEEAERALCWLRGWVQPSLVKKELTELIEHNHATARNKSEAGDALATSKRTTNTNNKASSNTSHGSAQQFTYDNLAYTGDNNEELQHSHSPARENDITDAKPRVKVLDHVMELGHAPTRRPLLVIIPFFFFTAWSGYIAVRPFMVQVFMEFQMPVSAEWATVIQASTSVLGGAFLMISVHRIGKRRLALLGSTVKFTTNLLLGIYVYVEVTAAKMTGRQLWASWVPLLLFAMMSFMNGCFEMIPWVLLCELFPFRTRSLSVGISSACYYFFAFLASKTYLDIQQTFKLHGAFWLYSSINVVCFIFLYFRLPETEGKSLEDIQLHFARGHSSRTKQRD